MEKPKKKGYKGITMKERGFIVASFGALTAWLGDLAIPVYVLVACNIIDYVTGLIASSYRGEKLSSYVGIKGIYKKVLMWLLVVVGFFVDMMINYSIHYIGIEFNPPVIVAILVAVWLCFNEILSILENISDMNVPLPPFLKPIIEKIKSQVEEKADKMVDETGKDKENG